MRRGRLWPWRSAAARADRLDLVGRKGPVSTRDLIQVAWPNLVAVIRVLHGISLRADIVINERVA